MSSSAAESLGGPKITQNGSAVTALVLGIVGAVFGIIPLTSFLAIILGLLGLIFGIVALVMALRGKRGRKVMAIAGTVLSIIALALGAWGMSVMSKATEELTKSLEGISGAPEATGATGDSDGQESGAAEDATSAESVAKFGQAYTFEDGTKVTVSEPTVRKFGPSSSIAGQSGVVVKVSITAGEKTLTGAVVSVNARQGDIEVPSAIDVEENIDGMITNDIRPGKTLTETYAFSADDAENFEVIVQPGFRYNEAVFTS